jgi:hypothetical protein
MKLRLLILAVMLVFMTFTSHPAVKADGGNGCMDQWSECRLKCAWWDDACRIHCDFIRNQCLAGLPQ